MEIKFPAIDRVSSSGSEGLSESGREGVTRSAARRGRTLSGSGPTGVKPRGEMSRKTSRHTLMTESLQPALRNDKKGSL